MFAPRSGRGVGLSRWRHGAASRPDGHPPCAAAPPRWYPTSPRLWVLPTSTDVGATHAPPQKPVSEGTNPFAPRSPSSHSLGPNGSGAILGHACTTLRRG